MTAPQDCFAVLEGALYCLGPFGSRALRHEPLATAILEFRRGPLCTYVREHPYGLLPGVPNLYCLDGAHRLAWMADWPLATDPCARILDERNGELIAQAASGAMVRLDALTGRFIGLSVPAAEAI
ncbi:MAG: hypothetical protein JNL39_14225 [Opitutaceae bacterium]|nr:hypothetical protein [Opitutaceae bacterium]